MSETPIYAPSLPPPTTTPYQRRHERIAQSPYPLTNHASSTPDAKTPTTGGWLGSVRTFIGDALSKLTANVARADADATMNAPPTAALSPLTLPPYSFDSARARRQASPLNARPVFDDAASTPMNGVESSTDETAAVPYRKRARAPSMSLSTPIRPAPSPPPTTFRTFDSAQMLSASPAPHHRQHIATIAVTYTPLQPPSQSSSSISAQRILSSISRQSTPIIDTKRTVRTPLISPQPIIMAETNTSGSSARKSRPSLRGRFDPTRKLFTPIKARMAETEMKLNSEMTEERKYDKQQDADDDDALYKRQERPRDRTVRKATSTPSQADSYSTSARDDEANHVVSTKRARRQVSDDDETKAENGMEDERPTTITVTKPQITKEVQSEPSDTKASTSTTTPSIPASTFSVLPPSPKPSTLPINTSSTSLSNTSTTKPVNPFLTSSSSLNNTTSKLSSSNASTKSDKNTSSDESSGFSVDDVDQSEVREDEATSKANTRIVGTQSPQPTNPFLFTALTSSSSSTSASKPLLSFPSFDTTPTLASSSSRSLLTSANPTNIVVTAPATSASTISSSSTALIAPAKVSARAAASGECKVCGMSLEDVDHSDCVDEEASAPIQLSGAPSFSLNIPANTSAPTAVPRFSFPSAASTAAPLTFSFPSSTSISTPSAAASSPSTSTSLSSTILPTSSSTSSFPSSVPTTPAVSFPPLSFSAKPTGTPAAAEANVAHSASQPVTTPFPPFKFGGSSSESAQTSTTSTSSPFVFTPLSSASASVASTAATSSSTSTPSSVVPFPFPAFGANSLTSAATANSASSSPSSSLGQSSSSMLFSPSFSFRPATNPADTQSVTSSSSAFSVADTPFSAAPTTNTATNPFGASNPFSANSFSTTASTGGFTAPTSSTPTPFGSASNPQTSSQVSFAPFGSSAADNGAAFSFGQSSTPFGNASFAAPSSSMSVASQPTANVNATPFGSFNPTPPTLPSTSSSANGLNNLTSFGVNTNASSFASPTPFGSTSQVSTPFGSTPSPFGNSAPFGATAPPAQFTPFGDNSMSATPFGQPQFAPSTAPTPFSIGTADASSGFGGGGGGFSMGMASAPRPRFKSVTKSSLRK